MNHCIYCNKAVLKLSDEHVIPYGLEGRIILKSASCTECSKVTSLFEQYILRGHWLGVRKNLNFKSRHPSKQPKELDINIVKFNGIKIRAKALVEDCSFQLVFLLFEPEILSKEVIGGKKPYTKNIGFTSFGEIPKKVFINNQEFRLSSTDSVEFLIKEFTAENFFRFLAKIAHSYALKERGLDCCKKFFLPEIILGNTENAMTYIGAASEINQNSLPYNIVDIHSLKIIEEGNFLTVLIKLFNLPGWQNQPTYQIVVGEL